MARHSSQVFMELTAHNRKNIYNNNDLIISNIEYQPTNIFLLLSKMLNSLPLCKLDFKSDWVEQFNILLTSYCKASSPAKQEKLNNS